MSSIPVFVGLDYHQDSVQVCVLDRDGRRLANVAADNDASAVAQVVLRHGRPVRIAIEACCGAADMAEELIVERKLPVELAHPGYVARLKRSPDKTDFADAHASRGTLNISSNPAGAAISFERARRHSLDTEPLLSALSENL